MAFDSGWFYIQIRVFPKSRAVQMHHLHDASFICVSVLLNDNNGVVRKPRLLLKCLVYALHYLKMMLSIDCVNVYPSFAARKWAYDELS